MYNRMRGEEEEEENNDNYYFRIRDWFCCCCKKLCHVLKIDRMWEILFARICQVHFLVSPIFICRISKLTIVMTTHSFLCHEPFISLSCVYLLIYTSSNRNLSYLREKKVKLVVDHNEICLKRLKDVYSAITYDH